MCGIFGVLVPEKSNFSFLESAVNRLFKLSESRGKEAAGIAVYSNHKISVYKEPIPASSMVRTKTYKKLINDVLNQAEDKTPIAVIGHSRLVTNGLQEINTNNQPVIKIDMVGVHNGIIVNEGELWERFPSLQRKYEIDTEIILSLIGNFYREKKSLAQAVRNAYSHIYGSASIAVLNQTDKLILATNTGSLYTCTNQAGSLMVFASERYIIETFIQTAPLRNILGRSPVSRINAGSGWLVDIGDLSVDSFRLDEENISQPAEKTKSLKTDIVEYPAENKFSPPSAFTGELTLSTVKGFKDPGLSEKKYLQIFKSLKRCTACVLPHTIPFIEFDENGVCNYCRDHRKLEFKGEEALAEDLGKYRSKSGEPDCVIAFSGGRDSSYALHYVKNVLKMNPIAYTYDWGMVTDLARRNQARMCGKLGIEHIIVSADINKKRKYIRNHITAWLKKPDLGMIPLFMSGDKPFHYYGNVIREQNKIKPLVYSMNRLEKSEFKAAFSGGASPKKQVLYRLSLVNLLRITVYYGKQFVLNPSYLNTSIMDIMFGFYSYYIIPHSHQILFFNYLEWNEEKIVSTLIDEYDWEVAGDTKNTWRIGDGTAAFYNYIYYTVAGLTENDTFRSNQIREGLVSRDKALEFILEENKPRYDSIAWYGQQIGFDWKEALKKINSMPKLYNLITQ